MRLALLFVSALFFVALGALGLAWSRLSSFLMSPMSTDGVEKTIVVPAGADLLTVSGLLEDAELVQPGPWLELYLRHLHRDAVPMPGEYSLSTSMTPLQQLERLQTGRVVTYTFVLREGARASEIIDDLVERGLGDAAQLRALVEDDDFARSLGIDAPSLEGYLFPDAYTLPRGLDAEHVLATFVKRFDNIARPLFAELPGPDLHARVTLASMVEASRLLESERRFYAALLLNRLAAGQALECAAALYYGESKVGPDATPEDNLWSTRKPGLPATPITNPGLDALRALAAPAVSKARWIAARDDGSHVFCEDFECLDAAWRRYGRKPGRWIPRPRE